MTYSCRESDSCPILLLLWTDWSETKKRKRYATCGASRVTPFADACAPDLGNDDVDTRTGTIGLSGHMSVRPPLLPVAERSRPVDGSPPTPVGISCSGKTNSTPAATSASQ